MLDPDRLTFVQWFWICFVIVLLVFFICRWLDLSTAGSYF